MKYYFFIRFLLIAVNSSTAQNNFTGIAKYKITAEGSNNLVTDSMSVIFGSQKVKVILYLPGTKSQGGVSQKVFIDDFSTKKSIVLNTENNTYRTSTLPSEARYTFIRTNKIAESNNSLCFQYVADSGKLDKSLILRADCLGSIEHKNSLIKNYYFLSIQPIIIDNRIVMDFVVTEPDGGKQRIYIYDIQPIEDVASHFNLDQYKKVK